MPAAVVSDQGSVPAVVACAEVVGELLARGGQTKPSSSIEPVLQKADFGDISGPISTIFTSDDISANDTGSSTSGQAKGRKFAVIETAIRNLFSHLIASMEIGSPDFVRVWNLFDLISILSDDEQCEPALLFWLVEELLDSQTIAGCRAIFDFLESRRERITTKHFDQKKLVILRSCNELLRRLSRAEDTAFCGRVFIFMFQSFPLGDRSSVNLRGEYHVENVTAYDQDAAEESAEKMDVDNNKDAKLQPQSKAVSFDAASAASQASPMKPDALYPVFWSLQESFSQPKKLFEPKNLASFKHGLEATLTTFRAIQEEQGSRPSKAADGAEGSVKRKREGGDESDLANTFNPKYLTSRDLFELEISDLSFRRHILVQAFIIIELLLSISPEGKEKLDAAVSTPNKSVTYMDSKLDDKDVQWTKGMKKKVEDCLKQGNDGPQFHRMIDTVLARDKNWVRWKAEGCQAIELPAVPASVLATAQSELRRATTNKRRRMVVPLNSLPLDFMTDRDYDRNMDNFKAPERYELPELCTFKGTITADDLEIEMPVSDDSRDAAVESKASKTWRALRVAAKTKLALFDMISDSDNIEVVYGEVGDPDVVPEPETETETETEQQQKEGEGDGEVSKEEGIAAQNDESSAVVGGEGGEEGKEDEDDDGTKVANANGDAGDSDPAESIETAAGEGGEEDTSMVDADVAADKESAAEPQQQES